MAYAAWGVHLSTFDLSGDAPGLGVAFDSSAPPGTDYDLGTPNEAYGGPGTGAGGGSNDRALGNLLIRAERTDDVDSDGRVDTPDDHADGARFVFDFDADVCLTKLELVDIDDVEGSVSLTLEDAAGVSLGAFEGAGAGDNSRVTVTLSTCGVARLTIALQGSGAVDELEFCAGP